MLQQRGSIEDRLTSWVMRRAILGLVAIAGVSAGCGNAGAPPAGERLAARRDLVSTFFWKSRVLAYATLAGSGTPDLQDLWIRDLDQPEPRVVLSDLDWSP